MTGTPPRVVSFSGNTRAECPSFSKCYDVYDLLMMDMIDMMDMMDMMDICYIYHRYSILH